jgi:hypothetical protein
MTLRFVQGDSTSCKTLKSEENRAVGHLKGRLCGNGGSNPPLSASLQNLRYLNKSSISAPSRGADMFGKCMSFEGLSPWFTAVQRKGKHEEKKKIKSLREHGRASGSPDGIPNNLGIQVSQTSVENKRRMHPDCGIQEQAAGKALWEDGRRPAKTHASPG